MTDVSTTMEARIHTRQRVPQVQRSRAAREVARDRDRLGSGHEYLYVVDFDKRTFTASGYGHLLGNWSFDELPTKADFIAKTEPEDED